MRHKKREQLLIRLITLLDDAELGERRETILDLLHSARRACRAGSDIMAGQYVLDAHIQLRKARHSLQVTGVSERIITPLEYALDLLRPVCEDVQADQRPLLTSPSLTWRVLVLLVLLPAGMTLATAAVFWSTRHLLHL